LAGRPRLVSVRKARRRVEEEVTFLALSLMADAKTIQGSTLKRWLRDGSVSTTSRQRSPT
jgi:hypothetical protein